ncbi:hypothetical protein HK405_014910, partial [Cladochytrium tenue]
RIIFISSNSAIVPFHGGTEYATSKRAIESVADCLRAEMMQFGVHVATILPGPITSPLWTKLPPSDLAAVAITEQPSEAVGPTPTNAVAADTTATTTTDSATAAAYVKMLESIERNQARLERLAATPRATTSPALLHAVRSSVPRLRYFVDNVGVVVAFTYWLLGDRLYNRVLAMV